MYIPTAIDQAILRTIIYFDIVQFPLTPLEVLTNLIERSSTFPAVQKALNLLVAQHKLATSEGFYFLPGKEHLVAQRKERYLLAHKKYAIALKNARLLRRCPFVKAIYVTNSLAYDNAAVASDIDLAIITAPGRAWTARLWCAGVMKLLRRRPTSTDKKDKICLSFFMDQNTYNLHPIAYPRDVALSMWLSHWWPVYDPDNVLPSILQANTWNTQLLPNMQPTISQSSRTIQKKSWLQKMLQLLMVHRVESRARSYQTKIMPSHITTGVVDRPHDVVLHDGLIKMHTHGSREHVNQLWEQRCKSEVPRIDVKTITEMATKMLGT